MASIQSELLHFEQLRQALERMKDPNVTSVDLGFFGLTRNSHIVQEFLVRTRRYEIVGNKLVKYDRTADLHDKKVRRTEDIERYNQQIEHLHTMIREAEDEITSIDKELSETWEV